ncbi:MAG: acyltransferase [Anaerolineales bacterium]|nr:acyltransferase [Anaerolineales bacterium]
MSALEPPMKNQVEINRYEFIDALRGFAILMVIFTHTTLIVSPSLPLLRLVASRGVYGVQLFYVVSALTLFLSTDQRRRVEKNPTLNFFIRRFFRIAPLFYLAIFFYTLRFGTGPNYWAPNGIGWLQYLSTVLFLNGWHPEAINAIIPLGWSIAVEMTFYLMIPYLYKILKDKGATLIFIVVSLTLQKILVALYEPFLIQYFPGYLVHRYFDLWLFSQLPIFGLGVLAYQVLRQRERAYDKILGGALTFAALFMFASFLDVSSYQNLIPIYFFYGLAFLTFTLGLYFNPNKILVNPVTRWIGKVSYGLYFVHYPVLLQIKLWFPLDAYFGKTAQFAVYFIAALIISSLVAAITYQFVEVYGMNLGKKIIWKLEH